MKYSLKNLLYFTAGLLLLTACEKVENKIVFEGGTPPTLSATIANGQMIPLSNKTKTDPAITFMWTNPDYKFNTGVSSQNVNYTLQIDTAGANFSSKDLQEKSLIGDLKTTFTMGELNAMLAKLQFLEDVPGTIEVRLKSSLQDGSVALYSNVQTFTVVPFLDVAVPLPTTGELWLVGSATPNDWNNPTVSSQQLTRVSATTFTITINLKGGQEFLVIPKNGDWGNKYAAAQKDIDADPEFWKGGPFGFNSDKNFPGPPADGTYKITFEFKTGKFSVQAQ